MDKNKCLQPEKWESYNGLPYPKLLVRTKLDPSINLEHLYSGFYIFVLLFMICVLYA